MKISDNYYLTRVDDSFVLFPTVVATLNGGKTMKLNEMGYTILKLLEEDLTFDELLEKILTEINPQTDDIENIKCAIDTFLCSIKNNGVLL